MASPWGEGFFCRAIFKKIGFSHQLSQSAKSDSRAQPLPRGSGQRSWTQGVRSTTEGEIFKGTDGACADPGTQNFPCRGARTQPTFPPSSFISLTFTSHTGSLLLSSLKKVTFPSFLRPPISRKRLDISRQIAYHESGHNLLRGSIS